MGGASRNRTVSTQGATWTREASSGQSLIPRLSAMAGEVRYSDRSHDAVQSTYQVVDRMCRIGFCNEKPLVRQIRLEAPCQTNNAGRIFVARVFWLFDIRPAPGHQYRADEEAFRADTVRPSLIGPACVSLTKIPQQPNLCLKPFPARLIPRSTRHAEVATAEWNEREQDLNELLSDKL